MPFIAAFVNFVAVQVVSRWLANAWSIVRPAKALKNQPTGRPSFDPDDRTIPVVFGTRWVQPVNLWYGDLAMKREGKITATNTRGYSWMMGWHQGLAFAPIDGILKIRLAGTRPSVEQPLAGMIWDADMFDTLTAPPAAPQVGARYWIGTGATGAWTGHDGETAYWNGANWVFFTAAEGYHEITSNEQVWLLNSFILGGGYAEGGSGLGGDLDVMFGADDQIENTYLQSQLGADIPAFRGILSAVYYNSVTGHGGLAIQNSDEIPVWEYLLRRQVAGAGIGAYDMAGSSIVTQALTNADWGLGRSATELDAASFAAALATEVSEGMGLSLVWDGSQPVQDLLDMVMEHIAGVLYVEPATDKFVLKLIRDDYVPASLPVLDESNLVRVESYSRPAQGECYNAVVASFTNRIGDTETITLHETAAIIAAGGVVNAAEINYPAFCDAATVGKAAARELRNLVHPLSSAVLVGNRELATLRPGDPFKFSWTKFGVDEEVMRVTAISWGTLADGEVRISCTQDAFGASTAAAATPPGSDWSGLYPVVLDILTAPPGAPDSGDSYLIGVGATGAWSGHDGEIATWDGSQWVYETPHEGGIVYVADEQSPYRYNEDSEWEVFVGGMIAVDHDGTWEDPVPVWTGSIWRHASGGLRYKDDVPPTSDDDGVEFGFGGIVETIP